MGQKKLGLNEPQVIKAAGMLGGGVARAGEVCGALTGAVMALSSLYSRGSLDEAEDPRMREAGREMVRRFEEIARPHGGILCREIARVDWNDPAAAEAFRKSPESRRSICMQVVGETAQALGGMLERQGG